MTIMNTRENFIPSLTNYSKPGKKIAAAQWHRSSALFALRARVLPNQFARWIEKRVKCKKANSTKSDKGRKR
ncbi:uncharacterized protein LOC143900780 isoform X3 [Temnothorax americanus]|uniref:uncharacterized protein LOC143900780 isoform X3 n=1 Tax=Temnothorax americanus TaxID=1964332 RepID=UPI004067A85A